MRTASVIFFLAAANSTLARPGFSHHANPVLPAHEPHQTKPRPASKQPVAATWFASWHAQDFPLSNVSWSKYTTVIYSFAETTPDLNVVNITNPEVFKDFVSTAHANNCSAAVSVGGWDGSLYFSTAVATAENRTAFVKTMTNLVQENDLDGLDFDWESPGLAGVGCNTKSPNDTSNFLTFLTELRAALPNVALSAAASIRPFVSSDQSTPSTNVSGFASVFDYIAIMNYDVWGPWSPSVGPNAPLNDTCVANATNRVGSAVSAVEAWTSAGIPVDQLVLGVSAYGRGYSVSPADAFPGGNNTLGAYVPFNKTFTPKGDAWDVVPAPGALDVCGNSEVAEGGWDFWGLIAGGFLNENGTANTAEGINFSRHLVPPAAKGSFIKSLGLRGFSMWEADGDFNDILLNSIRCSAGSPGVDSDDEGCETTTTTAPTSTSDSTTATS
ncbi:hypothetical protein FRC07_014912 [Ceratobasidium sp. 392]|nr:hypothetical protein FRC07_014912 [Ceratobasidium sp. 392]